MSNYKQETMYNEPSTPYVEQPGSIRRPRDYLILSILNILFGNLIFGLIALYFSIKTRNNVRGQMLEAAQRTSRKALIFNIIASISMIIVWIIVIVLIVVFRRRRY